MAPPPFAERKKIDAPALSLAPSPPREGYGVFIDTVVPRFSFLHAGIAGGGDDQDIGLPGLPSGPLHDAEGGWESCFVDFSDEWICEVSSLAIGLHGLP